MKTKKNRKCTLIVFCIVFVSISFFISPVLSADVLFIANTSVQQDALSKSEIKKMNKQKFEPTNDSKQIQNADFIIICVPTPLEEDKTPDLNYIKSAAATISKVLNKGQFVILESTTFPGTTLRCGYRWSRYSGESRLLTWFIFSISSCVPLGCTHWLAT